MKRVFFVFGLAMALSLHGMNRDTGKDAPQNSARARRNWLETIPPYVGPMSAVGLLGFYLMSLCSDQ